MRIEKKEKAKIIEVSAEVKLRQDNHDLILEKGDRIKILSLKRKQEAIPQENLKRAFVRDHEMTSDNTRLIKPYGFRNEDIIGWFATTHNIASGWLILRSSNEDKREFGEQAFRSISAHHGTMSIIKINLRTGTYAFLDNKAYEEGQVVFQRLAAYDRLIIEPTNIAFEEFNIV